jgi:IclR family pca regulon transcriptional regulator
MLSPATMAAKPKRGTPSSKPERGSGQSIQSVIRALGILELFDENRPALTTSEIANLTGLNRATAYRFCQTLLGLGYLEDTGHGTLRPGLKAISLARAALSSRELPELAMSYLRDLQAKTGETVNMALLDGAEVVYVSRLLSDHILTLRLFIGSRLPAWTTSLGRAILAFMDDDEIERILDASELRQRTERTVVDPDKLRAELRRIRTRGYAINDQEFAVGLLGVAAPIFGVSGEPIAAINISIPHPIEKGRIDSELAPAVVEAARSISDLASRIGAHAV